MSVAYLYHLMSDEYRPLVDREREPKSRVHEELPKSARERLTQITLRIKSDRKANKNVRKNAFESLIEKIGYSPVVGNLSETKLRKSKSHREFVFKGDTIPVLTYIELLYMKGRGYSYTDKTNSELEESMGPVSEHHTFEDIYNVLVTEGLLWEIEWAGKGGVIRFKPLASTAMKEIDEKVQALTNQEPWGEALEGYDAAFNRYLNGDFDELIPKKLYNSVEEVLQTICVDLEGWTENRDLSHTEYLKMLNENGVYNANGITAPELGSLLDALEKLVAKVGNDRKQRHTYIDREYCTLLVHQIGSYLYFLINRYESYKEK